MTFREGARIAVDVGGTRVGVARSDTGGVLVLPVATLTRRAGGEDVARIARMVREYDAIEVIVGLPLGMSGREGASALAARRYAEAIAREAGVPVRLVDERLSSVSAHQLLRDSGRSERRHRPVVDQVAATVILEQALEQERRTGEPPGELVAKENG
ncbi:MAG TPA: Holliday junction resolvase RuvX [Actinomycetaceae bacterium]|nr:Holliday junction resolvase RuvX [Actinomycetaceae bacterium]